MLAIVWWLLIGLAAGAIARFLMPGRQPMTTLMTMLLGVVGSLVGGFISWTFTGGPDRDFEPAGLLMSIVGALIVLAVFGMSRNPRRV